MTKQDAEFYESELVLKVARVLDKDWETKSCAKKNKILDKASEIVAFFLTDSSTKDAVYKYKTIIKINERI